MKRGDCISFSVPANLQDKHGSAIGGRSTRWREEALILEFGDNRRTMVAFIDVGQHWTTEWTSLCLLWWDPEGLHPLNRVRVRIQTRIYRRNQDAYYNDRCTTCNDLLKLTFRWQAIGLIVCNFYMNCLILMKAELSHSQRVRQTIRR